MRRVWARKDANERIHGGKGSRRNANENACYRARTTTFAATGWLESVTAGGTAWKVADREEPYRVLSLGAGVQSTTLLLMSLAGEIPAYDYVIYADTGWEPKKVYEQVSWLESLCHEAGVPFFRVENGSIREDVLQPERKYSSMPLHVAHSSGKAGMLKRQCSYRYKMIPVLHKLREIAGLRPYQHSKKVLINLSLGISLDEVVRMRPGERPWIVNEYPLVEMGMSRTDCINWCVSHGYPEPPRSACIGCPLKGHEEWAKVAAEPEDWADAVAFDEALRAPGSRISGLLDGQAFVHRSLLPLVEVRQAGDEQPALWGDECRGMCGV